MSSCTLLRVSYIPTAWVSYSALFILQVFSGPQRRTGRSQIPRFSFVVNGTSNLTCPIWVFGGRRFTIMINDGLLSKTIDYLRFPLAVGVVFIHNKMDSFDIQGKEVNYGDFWPWLNYVIDFFSAVLPTIAVPLFFFISGFLFFYKIDFSKAIYIKKLKSRSRTLLIPYLIWNFIGFLILLTQMEPRFFSLFPLLKDYRIDLTEFLSYFWIRDLPMDPPTERAVPIDGPLWFVRDLIILVLVSPLIYWLIKKLKYWLVVLLGIVWFFHLGKHIGLPGLCHQSIFFFPLGAYFSINKINFVELANKIKWSPCLYAILAIGDTITKGEPYNHWFHNLGVMVGIFAVVCIASLLLVKDRVHINKFLSDASFFVFAAHGLFISKFMKALIMTVQPQSSLVVLFIYFFVPITTILICLGIYKILNRWMPSLARVVTGGR